MILFILCDFLVNRLAGRRILEEALEDFRVSTFSNPLAFWVITKLATAFTPGESLSQRTWLVEVVRGVAIVSLRLQIFSRFLIIIESTLRISGLEGVVTALRIPVPSLIFMERVAKTTS